MGTAPNGPRAWRRILRLSAYIVPCLVAFAAVVMLLTPPDNAADDRATVIVVGFGLLAAASFFGLRAVSRASIRSHNANVIGAARDRVVRTSRSAKERYVATREGRSFAGVLIDGENLCYQGRTYPLAGLTATVESAGQITQRLSATRLVLLGVFSLAAPKQKDQRELYLTVEGSDFVFTVPVDPDQGAAARAFAATLNSEGRRRTMPNAVAPPPERGLPDGDASANDPVADALRRLESLHTSGVISEAEYAQKRTEILGRL